MFLYELLLFAFYGCGVVFMYVSVDISHVVYDCIFIGCEHHKSSVFHKHKRKTSSES
jgi:hypothetical protein